MSEENKNNTNNETNEHRPKKRKILIPLAIIVGILVGVYFYHESFFESTDDAYVEADIIQVTPKVAGHIVESYVKDNMEVKQGDLVAKIDDEVYIEKYNKAKADYEKAILNQNSTTSKTL